MKPSTRLKSAKLFKNSFKRSQPVKTKCGSKKFHCLRPSLTCWTTCKYQREGICILLHIINYMQFFLFIDEYTLLIKLFDCYTIMKQAFSDWNSTVWYSIHSWSILPDTTIWYWYVFWSWSFGRNYVSNGSKGI